MKKSELRKMFLDIYPYTIGYYTNEDDYEYNHLVGMKYLLEAILGDTDITFRDGKLSINRNNLYGNILFDKLNNKRKRKNNG